MNRYNVMTVLNGDYFDFGKMFVNSFYHVMNLDHLNKLYIYDTGLTQKNKDYLAGFPKLEIISTGMATKHVNLHDQDWCKNVYSKTAYLLQVVEKDQLPVFMVDSDCMFVKDFLEVVPEDKDFVVCQRESGSFCEYIASFFAVINVEKAKEFITDWRREMYYGTEDHKESPALSRLIYENKYEVAVMKEDVISATKPEIDEQVYIVHMKSADNLRTVEARIKQPHLLKYCDQYLTDCPSIGKDAFEEKYGESAKKSVDGQKALQSLNPAQRALLLKRLKK